MSQLLVFGVDSPQTAEKGLDLAGDLHRQELLQLADAAWVERELIEALQRDHPAGPTISWPTDGQRRG